MNIMFEMSLRNPWDVALIFVAVALFIGLMLLLGRARGKVDNAKLKGGAYEVEIDHRGRLTVPPETENEKTIEIPRVVDAANHDVRAPQRLTKSLQS